MKISIIAHGAHGGSGGIDKYTSHVIDVLNDYKHIKLINIFSKKKIHFKSKKINQFFSIGNLGFPILLFLNTLKILKSDIIFLTHINHIPLILIPILLNKKVILFSYGMEVTILEKNFFYKFLIKKINFFICMRTEALKIFKKKYALKNKFFFLLPNCIKIKKFKKLKISNQNNIITIARLWGSEKFKGVDETLEGIALLKKTNFTYYVIGSGDDMTRLKSKAKKLKVIKNVKFFGQVSNKKRDNILEKSSLMSMPGSGFNFDTYPARFAFLEAALSGLKILGSNPFPSEKYLEKKYKNLNFVNPKNTSQISNTIFKLLKQKKKYDKKYLNDFSYDNFNIKLINILNKINCYD